MAARYGHAWLSNYGASPTGLAAAEWRDTLAGIDRDQLRDGFRADALRGDDFPPSSARFRALCFDVPSLAVIDAAFGSSESRDPFVRLMWRFIDGWEYRNADVDKARMLRRNAYAAAKEHVLCGGDYPEAAPRRLPQEKPLQAPVQEPEKTPEERAAIEAGAEAAKAQLQEMFGVELKTHDRA